MTDNPRGIDATSRRLDRLTTNLSPQDGLLRLAAVLGRSGMAFPVGMIVSGVMITGALSSLDHTAAALEANKTKTITGFFGEGSELHETLQDVFAGAARSIVESDKTAVDIIDKYPSAAGIDDFADEDYEAVLRMQAPVAVVDIAEARIQMGSEWVEVEALRVNVHQIGAWWPLGSQHGANVIFHRADPPLPA